MRARGNDATGSGLLRLRGRRALRWLAPVGVLGAAAVVAGGMIAARANPGPLPPATPVDLVAGLQNPEAPGFSGTVVARMSLGLPELPGVTAGVSGSSLISLLAGSHTLRVWSGGADQQRVALLGSTDETDVFHSGTDIWQWDSSTHTATHLTLPRHAERAPKSPSADASSLTPQALASQALASMSKNTEVKVDGTRVIADRSTYVLALTPKDRTSRVGSVRISVDGKTKLPLAVQVFARGSQTPSIDVAFTDVSFRTPSAGYFRFTPPPGVTVHDSTLAPHKNSAATATTQQAPSVIGSGWSSIVSYRASGTTAQELLKSLPRSLPHVSGAWGSGRLLDSALVTALVTDDGHVFAGAVDPDSLYAAAAAHK